MSKLFFRSLQLKFAKSINKYKISPNYLYKYYPFNQYSKDIICRKELYFQTPNEFNDPFDRGMDISFSDSSEEKIKKHLFKLLIQANKKEQNDDIEIYGKEFINSHYELFDPNISANKRAYIQNYVSFVKRAGVSCFSEKKDSNLMWSHYADKHSGFCVEFNFKKLSEALVRFNLNNGKIIYLDKVIYAKKYPLLSAVNNDELVDSLFIKSSDWKYECEWRAVYDEGCGEIISLPTDVITGVYLGLELEEDNYTIIKQSIIENKLTARIYKAKKVKNTFRLMFERIII